MDSLVSTFWLEAELGAPDLRVVDTTYALSPMGRDPRAEYEAAHIPGAVFFDIDEIADAESPLPHMFPDTARFASRVQALGIGDGSRIVVYDDSPLHSSARAWWMLKSFGAREVAILDGGLRKWRAEGRPMESGIAAPRPGHFTARLHEGALADKAFMLGLIGGDSHAVADARALPRFAGDAGEPRPGLASGHIPGSVCLPFGSLFDADNCFRPVEELRALFDEAGIDLAKPLVATCGSGITAAVILFAAHLLGKEDVRLYDGSWAEWGADPATPKAWGAAA